MNNEKEVELISCFKCGEMVEKRFRKCPKCGKPTRNPKGCFIILGVFALLIVIGAIIEASVKQAPSSDDTLVSESSSSVNLLLTDGVVDVFEYDNSVYLVTGLYVLSKDNVAAIVSSICKVVDADQWAGSRFVYVVNEHKKVGVRLPSMTEACAAPDQYYPREGVEDVLYLAEFVERFGYGAFR